MLVVLAGFVLLKKRVITIASLKRFIERFPRVTSFYRRLRDEMDRHDKPLKTPWGFLFAGHETMAKGDFEQDETLAFREHMKSCDILINVGANVGYYCCHALNMDKEVIAVEPIHRNLHYLLTNLRINGWSQKVEVFPLALADKPDILKIWGGQTGASLVKGWASIPESYFNYVPVLTLDRILDDRLNGLRSFLLVDIEGAEYLMLKGAYKILKHEPRPVWMIEIDFAENQPGSDEINSQFESTFSLMFDAGYRAYLPDDKTTELSIDDIRNAVKQKKPFPYYTFIFK